MMEKTIWGVYSVNKNFADGDPRLEVVTKDKSWAIELVRAWTEGARVRVFCYRKFEPRRDLRED